MKLPKLFAVATSLSFLLAAGPKQPSAITVSCLNGGSVNDCALGAVQFTADGYPHALEILLDGTSLGGYVSFKGGNVDFTLSFSDPDIGKHTVTILDGGGKDAGTMLECITFDVH